MQETLVWSLDLKDPLEDEMEPHSNILAWKIPWTEAPGGLQSVGSQRVRRDWTTEHTPRGSFDKEIGLDVKSAFNHPLHQENSKSELKGKETGRKMLDLRFCRMEPWRCLAVNVGSSTRKGKKDLKVKQSSSGLHPLHSKTKQNQQNENLWNVRRYLQIIYLKRINIQNIKRTHTTQ